MAEGGNDGDMPKLPSGGSGDKQGKDVLKKREYDILDPEAKTKKSANEKIDDAKQTAKNVKKIIEKLAKIPWQVWLVILIIIIVVGIIAFLLTIPGLAIAKLKEIAQGTVDTVQSWFTNSANAYVNPEDVVELANYIEELDYDLVGYGFIIPNTTLINAAGYKTYEELKEEGYIYYERRDDDSYAKYYNEAGEAYTGYYYNSLGILIDGSTGKMVDSETYIDQYGVLRSTEETNSDGVGKIVSFGDDWLDKALDVNVDTTLLRSYLLSDYRIYAIRNNDQTTLNDLWTAIKQTFGGYDSAWAKGLIKFYYAENGLATEEWSSTLDSLIYGDSIKINGTNLSIKNGHFNNVVTFDIEGWADRYGMSLEFLLSLHVATMAPDLVYSMLQSFDTEVQVYLDDSGESDVEAEYVDMMNENATTSSGITFSDVKEKLSEQGGIDLNDWLVNASYYGYSLSSLGISKADAQYLLLNLPLKSPSNCTGQAQSYVIEISTSDSFIIESLSSNVLTNYGVSKAAEEAEEVYENGIYALIDEYEAYQVKDNSFGFNASNMDVSLGTDNSEYETNDNYSYFEDEDSGVDLSEYNYDESEAEIGDPEIDEFETEVLQMNSTVTATYKIENYKLYKIKRVKIERTYTGEVDGEEVEYTWTTFKYLIYEAGTATATAYSVDDWEYTWTYDYADEETWVDTVMFEIIIREKTDDELVEAGLATYDEETDSYTYIDASETRCSDNEDQTKCCSNCLKYVKSVVIALAQVTDADYAFYTPYIARVVGSWFRDTYFIIPEEADAAIDDYLNESSRSSAEIAMIENSYGSNSKLVIVDEEYLADTGEYWTAYEMQEDNPDEYQLYYLNPDGTTSDTKMEDFLSENEYSSQEEAEEAGHAFVKKAKTKEVTDISSADTESDVIWSAYGFDTNGAATGWIKIEREDGNEEVNKVYDIIGDNALNDEGGFYYNITSTNNVTQTEDAQRSETNATVKYIFKYRKYYIYDGTEETAEAIAEDKELVLEWAKNYLQEQGYSASDVASLLGKYGRSALRQTYSWSTISFDWDDVAEQWLSWQLDMYYSGVTNDCPEDDILLTDDLTVTINGTERTGDPRNPDLIATVNITKNSLNAFSILENTKTLAAEYSYRDFKELIVELNYFDKEDLSDAISEVFTWILPEVTATGWPIRPWDKQDNDYGALIESAQTYDYLEEIDYEVEDEDADEESDNDTTSDTETDVDSEGNQTILDKAQEILDVMVSEDWNYQSGSWADGLTSWEIAQSSGSKVSSCDTYVSWVLQEAGYLGESQRICHKSYGDSGESIKESYGDNLSDATWYFPDCTTTDYDLVPGDVVIIENDDWQSIGIYAGQNDSGENLYYGALSDSLVDRIVSEGEPITFNSFDSGNLVAVVRFDGGETSASNFEGWEDGDYVSSPVTGKVIEYGTHTRTNVYTEEEEEVGYIVIEAMSSKYFTEDNVAVNSGDTENLSNADAMEGLNYFYDEYEDTCSGYTIMIDGISVDLNLVDESDARGSYEQNEIYALYDSTEQNKRELQEQAKDDAPFVVVVGDEYEIDNFPTQEEGYVNSDTDDYVIYIKEGKYIGTCVSTYEETENTTDTDVDNTETTSDEYDGPAEYIRIMLKNMEDYSIVDNVEDYFNIPEEESSSSANILPGNTVEEKVWNALIQAGYSEISAAAAMGNIYRESGFQTNNLENQYEGTYNDETYTSAVDSGSYSKSQFTSDSYGYGLIQWTSSGRKEHLYEETVEKGLSISDADGQISVLIEELAGTWTSGGGNSDRDIWSNASSYSDLYDAVVAYCDGFEGAGVRAIDERYESAQEYYEKYGSGN